MVLVLSLPMTQFHLHRSELELIAGHQRQPVRRPLQLNRLLDISFLIELTPTIAIVLDSLRVFFINSSSAIYLFFQFGFLFSKKAEMPSSASSSIAFLIYRLT